MPTSIDALIRRIKPHKRAKRLVRRPGKDLPYIGDNPLVGPVMLDTTVYIHVAQGKAPPAVLATLAGGGPHLHASVCLAEIAVSLGRLDPGHARTKSRSSYLTELLRKTPAHRVHAPTADDWMSAGLLAGTVARLFDAVGRDRQVRRHRLCMDRTGDGAADDDFVGHFQDSLLDCCNSFASLSMSSSRSAVTVSIDSYL